jgi:hypothetical protein
MIGLINDRIKIIDIDSILRDHLKIILILIDQDYNHWIDNNK